MGWCCHILVFSCPILLCFMECISTLDQSPSLQSCITHPISVPSLLFDSLSILLHILWGQINQNLLGLTDYQGSVTSYYYLSLLVHWYGSYGTAPFSSFPRRAVQQRGWNIPCATSDIHLIWKWLSKTVQMNQVQYCPFPSNEQREFRMMSWDAVIWC